MEYFEAVVGTEENQREVIRCDIMTEMIDGGIVN